MRNRLELPYGLLNHLRPLELTDCMLDFSNIFGMMCKL